MTTTPRPLTPATLPAGQHWTPYCHPTWPPDSSTIDVIDDRGTVTHGCYYRHWDLIEAPKGWPLRVKVVGWRTHERKERS